MFFVFLFPFILFPYLLLSVNLKRFYSFVTIHSSFFLPFSFITFRVFFTSTLLSSLLHLFLSLSLSRFSSRLQLRFGLRRELRRSPSSPRVLLRHVGEQAEAPSSLFSLFSPVLYDGSSDCRRGRRVIHVRVRGPFRFRISRVSFHRPFVSFILLLLLFFHFFTFSPSSRSIEVTFITEHMVARTSGTCFGFSREIACSRVTPDYLERIEE